MEPAPVISKIIHISDVHFGRIAAGGVLDALVAEINDSAPDVVAFSGDLTQRARTREFAQAREMIDRIKAPVVVVPGNHDVRAWWHNPIERVFYPDRRFKKHITEDLTPSFSREGIAVFGINSAHGLTIKGGRIRSAALDAMVRYFEKQPPTALRVMVLHHHLLQLRQLGNHDVARGARQALRMAGHAGVDLILCGHLHASHVAHVDVIPPTEADPRGHRLVIATAGTAASNRWRKHDGQVNFYNRISVQADKFIVQERYYDPDPDAFQVERESIFVRT
ncbi:metallophosphoesterase family protein [soil metagenome]